MGEDKHHVADGLLAPNLFCFWFVIQDMSQLPSKDRLKQIETDPVAVDRIIEMAWEDRTPFEAIEFQFGLPEADVIRLMRKQLKNSSFRLWRKRVNSGVSQKHLQKRNPDISRFRCALQRTITHNKISKR